MPQSSPPVLLLGATGALGTHLGQQLQQRGHAVRALLRNPNRDRQRLGFTPEEVFPGDLRQPETLRAACQGIETVVSAAGASLALALRPGSPTFDEVDAAGHRNLAEAAAEAGVQRVAYVSVLATEATRDLAYVRAHLDAEAALQAGPFETTIVAPTGYFGSFDIFLTLARFGFAPAPGGGSAETNPIAEADLAAFVLDALDQSAGKQEVGGPEVITRRQIAQLALKARQRRGFVMAPPLALLKLQGKLLTPLDRRLAQLLAFFAAVSGSECLAPPTGSTTLAQYFQDRLGN
ncbi:MAG: NAD(P)H-binding protein [Acidobacteriota bacterium]